VEHRERSGEVEHRERTSLEDRLEQFPEAWRPKEGEKVVGTVLEISERASEYADEPYVVIVVLTDEGREYAVHAFHTVLRNEVARLGPKPGDRLGLKYFGKDEKRGYERYRVLIERAERSEPDPTGPLIEATGESDLPLGPADVS
jgi:hypothetical protein